MGNRAVITTENKQLGLYLHWNGGRDSVEAFLAYCKLKGFRSPETDSYGWARLAQVTANYFPAGLCVGISLYYEDMGKSCDNGVYVINNWKIVDRVLPYDDFEEQQEYPLFEMLNEINNAQPDKMKVLDEEISEFVKNNQTKFTQESNDKLELSTTIA